MMSIADFIPQMQSWIREFSHNNQEIMKLVDQVQFDPDQAIRWGISLLGNGAGNMMNIDDVSSGFHSQWIGEPFLLPFPLPAMSFFRKKSCTYRSEKYFSHFFHNKKQMLFLKSVL